MEYALALQTRKILVAEFALALYDMFFKCPALPEEYSKLLNIATYSFIYAFESNILCLANYKTKYNFLSLTDQDNRKKN